MIVEILFKSVISSIIGYFVKPIIDRILTFIKAIVKLYFKVRRIQQLPDSKWSDAQKEAKKNFIKKK